VDPSSASARLVEAFSSFQGEGPYAGAPQVFLRFELCNLRCRYCDTEESLVRQERFRIRRGPAGAAGEVEERANPVSADDLLAILDELDPRGAAHHSVSLTGGEPLLQARFLSGFLPRASDGGRRRFYLETDAVLVGALRDVLPHVAIVAADVKIPSATGEPPRWADHRAFLSACVAAGKETFVKLVVSRETTAAEISRALRESLPDRPMTVVIQPVTPRGGAAPPPIEAIAELVRAAAGVAREVRFLPQVHRLVGIP